ncbi:NAD(P)-binding protein [Cadophora sp. DSE1049]|nr:NAD(P)-binding protein [Cadophora sp. DSE1049]
MAAALSTSLASKAYIVTGGFSGIGLATVNKLLQRSATIHAVGGADSPPSSLTCADLATTSSLGKVYFYPSIDVSSRAPVQSAFKSILRLSPNISGLVNSAGICPFRGGILEDDDTFHKIIAVNLTGTWDGATELHMQCSGLTRTWALDFARYGIKVNLVAPGGTRSPLSAAQFDRAERGDMSRQVYPLIPMKRFAEPEELLVDTIIHSLSDESSYITGRNLNVNGGWP